MEPRQHRSIWAIFLLTCFCLETSGFSIGCPAPLPRFSSFPSCCVQERAACSGGLIGAKMRFQSPESGETMHQQRKLSRRDAIVLATLVAAPLAATAEQTSSQYGDEYWKNLVAEGKISQQAYNVLHLSKTERPFTSSLLKEKRSGVFKCASCGTPLFATSTKFDSGTGWPSFYDKLAGVELDDNAYERVLMMRTEVHCKTCKGHLGHVFDDGIIWNVPTGKRYCINGVSLAFEPAASDALATAA